MNAPRAKQRLKVAVLIRVFTGSGGGAETYSIRIVEKLALQHEVHVFAQELAQPLAGVVHHGVPMAFRKPHWLNLLWFGAYTRWHTRRGFDVVHSHENVWHGHVQTIHVRPVRFSLLGGRSGFSAARQWLRIAFSPRLLSYQVSEASRFRDVPGQQVVATSQALRAEAASAYPQAQSRLSVITPGVQLPEGAWDKRASRSALGLDHEGPLLLFVANDYARKGLNVLLQALAQLPVQVAVAAVGNPKEQATFTAQSRQLGLEGRVHFLGSLGDVGVAYQAADMLVHPTLEDSFAMVVLEAMAHGLPVVVSRAPYCGISTLLQHELQAILLDDPRDAKALALVLTKLLANPDLQGSLAKNAIQFAQAHDWDHAASAYERLYLLSARERTKLLSG